MRTPESDQQNQQKCKKCGKIVGCDYQGREHKCGCNQGDKMNVYSVSLCLSIEAEDKNDAIQQFYEKMNECAFDRDSIDIEIESDN